jgi:hypothetical protein
MHTQETEIGASHPLVLPTGRGVGELDQRGKLASLMRVISEQVAMPLDQVLRYLECAPDQGVGLLQALDDDVCLEHRRFLVGDPPWYWLSRRGAGLAGTGFDYRRPAISSLAHRRAMNEVRLYLAEQTGFTAEWVCEREIYRLQPRTELTPDALLRVNGEVYAIEVERSLKMKRDIREIVMEHSVRYDAVIYFCERRTYAFMKRLQRTGEFPLLSVRHMPGEKTGGSR